jgi:hypothetical protein
LSYFTLRPCWPRLPTDTYWRGPSIAPGARVPGRGSGYRDGTTTGAPGHNPCHCLVTDWPGLCVWAFSAVHAQNFPAGSWVQFCLGWTGRPVLPPPTVQDSLSSRPRPRRSSGRKNSLGKGHVGRQAHLSPLASWRSRAVKNCLRCRVVSLPSALTAVAARLRVMRSVCEKQRA